VLARSEVENARALRFIFVNIARILVC